MHKLIAIYKTPSNVDSFEEHYNNVHTPLALKIPLMKELRISHISGTPQGKSDLTMIAELCFNSKEDFNQAMKSNENMAAGKDLMSFAKEIVSVYFAEEKTTTL